MTREEAILHMTIRREELKHSVGDLDEDIKAFDMAIKALEKEAKTDRRDDMAEIELVIKIPEDVYTRLFDNGIQDNEIAVDDVCEMARTIRLGTPIEQESKTGRWMRKTRVDGVYDLAGVKTWGIKCQCDKCDFTTTVIEDFGYYKYCPNCGAKMKVEE